MHPQISSKVVEGRNSESDRIFLNKVCHKAYAGVFRGSRVCTQKILCQVVYAQLRSKFIKLGVTTMVLTHCIERWIVYLIPSRNTIESDVVLAHGIDKG